jgi:flagellar protein FlaG
MGIFYFGDQDHASDTTAASPRFVALPGTGHDNSQGGRMKINPVGSHVFRKEPEAALTPPNRPMPAGSAPHDTSATAAPRPEATASSLEDVSHAIAHVQEHLTPLAEELEFAIDRGTDRIVVKLIDSTSHKVLRQYPSEEVLKIAASIDNQVHGLLLDQEG